MAAEPAPALRRGRLALIAVIVVAAAVVIGVSATRHSGTHSAVAPTTSTTTAPVGVSKTPLELKRLSPAPKAIDVAATTPITLRFSAPLRANSGMPTLRPAVTGTWTRPSPTELRFTPSEQVYPLTRIVITVPSGTSGPESTTGEVLPAPITSAFTVAPGSTLRLQQLLAELDYLPVSFVPAGDGTSSVGTSTGAAPSTTVPSSNAALDAEPTTPSAISLTPLPGTMPWRFSSVPAQLKAAFSPGVWGSATLGAVIAFQSEHHLALDGSPGPAFWTALLQAVADRQPTTRPYDYVIVTETEPETLYIWQEGKVILQTPINTGVPGAATELGTWPVYLRYTSTTMTGTNPDGTHYVDPGVPWVSYFNGSDAVHGFPRPGYGYPQSDGCVEVPISTAAAVYPLDPYGTLVTVTTGDLSTELGGATPNFISPPTTPTTAAPAPTTTSTTTTTVPKRKPAPSTTVPTTTVPTTTLPATTLPTTTPAT